MTDIMERSKYHETERAAAAKAARDCASEADPFICWACREYACMDEDDDGVEACRYECPCHNTGGLVKDAAEEIARLRALIIEWAEADADVESMSKTGDGTTREWDKARRRNRDARLALHEECQPMKRNDRNAHAD